jgi:hypothetical protein
MKDELELAHKHCHHNREDLQASDICGCFHCCEIYSPSEIEDWIDNDDTAMCPKCHIDSVIASKSGFSITKEFLQEMYDHWFGRTYTIAEMKEMERLDG